MSSIDVVNKLTKINCEDFWTSVSEFHPVSLPGCHVVSLDISTNRSCSRCSQGIYDPVNRPKTFSLATTARKKIVLSYSVIGLPKNKSGSSPAAEKADFPHEWGVSGTQIKIAIHCGEWTAFAAIVPVGCMWKDAWRCKLFCWYQSRLVEHGVAASWPRTKHDYDAFTRYTTCFAYSSKCMDSASYWQAV